MRPRMRTPLLAFTLAVLSSTARADPPRQIELAIDPLGLMRDAYTLRGTYALTDHVALTGEALYVPTHDDSPAWGMTRLEASVRLFLDRAFQGPFVDAGLRYQEARGIGYTVDPNGNAAPFDGNYRVFGPRAGIGWQWTFHDAWSISYAVGVTKPWSQTSNVLGASAPGADTELLVGWVF